MKHLIKKLSKVAPSSSSSPSYTLLRSDSHSSASPRSHRNTKPSKKQATLIRRKSSVPSGHVPVYVGEDVMERFVISAHLMNHPIFVKLLNKSAQEYGYDQKGALKIPCDVLLFERLLDALICGRDVNSDVLQLINSLFNSSSPDDGLIL